MSTVTLLFIEGVIQPASPVLQCGQEAQFRPPSPQMRQHTSVRALDVWETIRDRFEEKVSSESLDFWTQRTIVYFAATSRFLSVSFLPFDPTSFSTWFIQKGRETPPLDGFYAPYLSKKKQKEWACIETLKRFDIINNPQQIDQSIEDVEAAVYPEMRTLLNYFLQDPLYAMIGVTYVVDTAEGHKTRFWFKQQLVMRAT